MRSDTAQRVQKRRAGLYRKPVNSICIIRTPYLRAVVKHARIKSPSAAAAVLNQNIRKSLQNTFLKRIQAENITVHRLAPSFRRKRGTTVFNKRSVHIPLKVGCSRGGNCTLKPQKNFRDNIVPGKIKNILVTYHTPIHIYILSLHNGMLILLN